MSNIIQNKDVIESMREELRICNLQNGNNLGECENAFTRKLKSLLSVFDVHLTPDYNDIILQFELNGRKIFIVY